MFTRITSYWILIHRLENDNCKILRQNFSLVCTMQPFSINNAQEYVGAVSNKWTPIRVPYLRLQKSGDKRRLYFCSYRCAVQTLLINNRQECSCDVFARKDNRSKTFSLSQIEQHNEWMDPRVVILDKRQIDFCSYRYKHYNKLYTVNLLIYINVMINLHKWILIRHLCSQKSENNTRESYRMV